MVNFKRNSLCQNRYRSVRHGRTKRDVYFLSFCSDRLAAVILSSIKLHQWYFYRSKPKFRNQSTKKYGNHTRDEYDTLANKQNGWFSVYFMYVLCPFIVSAVANVGKRVSRPLFRHEGEGVKCILCDFALHVSYRNLINC